MADQYDPERCTQLCELIAGGMGWKHACAELGLNPSSTWRWKNSHKDFREQYNSALETRAHKYADEVVEIADEATVEDVQVAKLRTDARKWVASKMLPKQYGDKVALTDPEGNALRVVVEIVDSSSPAPDEQP